MLAGILNGAVWVRMVSANNGWENGDGENATQDGYSTLVATSRIDGIGQGGSPGAIEHGANDGDH